MRRSLISLAVLIALSACTSAPQVTTPSGNKRVPINNEAGLAAYQAQLLREDADAKRQAAMEATIIALQKQLADLNTYIVVAANEQELNTPKGVPSRIAKEPTPKTKTTALKQPAAYIADLVQANGATTVFTVTHAVGNTAFNVPDEIRGTLLAAAKKGNRVEVRGRTDSYTWNAIDRDIALQRAVKAAGFLVRNGVAPDRIKVSYQTAGHFAVDNSSAAGRARNRRVEIEPVGATATPTAAGA